jgi:hypothetical protein
MTDAGKDTQLAMDGQFSGWGNNGSSNESDTDDFDEWMDGCGRLPSQSIGNFPKQRFSGRRPQMITFARFKQFHWCVTLVAELYLRCANNLFASNFDTFGARSYTSSLFGIDTKASSRIPTPFDINQLSLPLNSCQFGRKDE